MKTSTAVLFGSLAVNAVLVGLFVARSGSESPPADAPVAARAGTPARATPPGSTDQSRAMAAGNPLNLPAAEWKSLTSGDLRDLTAKLRAAGIPLNILTGILQYQLQQQYGERMKQLMGLTDESPPFWKPSGTSTLTSDPERYAAYIALNYEMTDKLKELLGDDFYLARMTPDVLESYRTSYGNLPTEKLVALLNLQDQYSRNSQILTSIISGVQTPEEREKQAQLQRDRRAAIVALLTPAELEEYDIHNSGLFLRTSLSAFNPSEEEFRALAKAQAAFNEKYPSYTPEESRIRASHQQELQDSLAAALTPERANDYKLSTASGSQQLARIVTRFELPTSAISEVLTVQKDIQDRAKAIQNDNKLDASTRSQQLASLADEAAGRIGETLGPKGLDAYRQTGGTWITQMVPRQPTPTPAVIR